ncbi:MAG TPA: hypothetical protein VFV50_11785 [Bdellovibrionales bacterium]|nr:hypothetical protein [Bdellovibrionales bacterium]
MIIPFNSEAKSYRSLIRCQVTEGYEVAVQSSGRSYFLALLYGSKVEYRERLRKPLRMKLERGAEAFDFELKKPGTEEYLVKIAAKFDGEASFDENVHYKIPPKSSKPKTYKLYEVAGNGLPLRDYGCYR